MKFRSLTKPTFTGVHDAEIRREGEAIAPLIKDRPLKPLPSIPRPLEDEDLGVELFAAGLPNESVERVLQTIRKTRRLVQWYPRCPGRPTEHEVVAHVVVPLMLGLGWSEQLMGVEWKRADAAFFRGTPTDEENCVMVCEVKKPGSPLGDAYLQAQKHANRLPNCSRVLATDGAFIFLYQKIGNTWPDQPSGYANLLKMRKDHLIPRGVSAVDTLVRLMPASLSR
jgi:hypothetical protein